MNNATSLDSKEGSDLRAIFSDSLPGRLEQMRESFREGALAGVQATAHTLAGSAATFGYPRVGRAAADLERLCRAGDMVGSRNAFDALCAAAHSEKPQAVGKKSGAANTSKLPLIMLVDDDLLLVCALAQALEADGYSVRTAASAMEALAILHAGEQPPDLAVLDITMPGMSGIDLATQMQSVPYIFLSASSGADIASQAAEAGAIGFLLKPIEPAQLLPAVRAALARAAEIQDLRAAEQRLTQALHEGRETGMAVGMLMERYRIDRHSALRMLRSHARSHQRKLNDVAGDLLRAAETLNAVSAPMHEAAPVRVHTQERRK